jgi:hypothetical protein
MDDKGKKEFDCLQAQNIVPSHNVQSHLATYSTTAGALTTEIELNTHLNPVSRFKIREAIPEILHILSFLAA